MESIAREYSDDSPHSWSAELLQSECAAFMERVLNERNDFVYRNKKILLKAIGQPEPEDEPQLVG